MVGPVSTPLLGTGVIELIGATREHRLDLEHSGGAVTTNLYARPTTGWELAQRRRIRAFRAGRYVLVVAEGDVPTPGHEVDIVQSPLKIFPPQFNVLHRQRPGMRPSRLRWTVCRPSSPRSPML